MTVWAIRPALSMSARQSPGRSLAVGADCAAEVLLVALATRHGPGHCPSEAWPMRRGYVGPKVTAYSLALEAGTRGIDRKPRPAVSRGRIRTGRLAVCGPWTTQDAP